MTVQPPLALSNKGGVITLLDEKGLKVDGVSYTKEQAKDPGWTVVFRRLGPYLFDDGGTSPFMRK